MNFTNILAGATLNPTNILPVGETLIPTNILPEGATWNPTNILLGQGVPNVNTEQNLYQDVSINVDGFGLDNVASYFDQPQVLPQDEAVPTIVSITPTSHRATKKKTTPAARNTCSGPRSKKPKQNVADKIKGRKCSKCGTCCKICSIPYEKKNDKPSHPLGRWISCRIGKCQTWVHSTCVGWDISMVEAKDFHCSECAGKEVSGE